MVTRGQVIAAARSRLEPLPYVHSMFEAGSAAFGAVDEFSDIDLVIDADDEHVAAVFEQLESALAQLGELDFTWRVPEPTWHGYSQRFYRVAGAPRFLYVDVVVREAGQPPRLNEIELHGEPLVYFDKSSRARTSSLDRAKLRETLRQRQATLVAAFPMLADLCRKELLRGRPIDAMTFYQSHVLRSLVELLRIRCCPVRHGFGLRYLERDLPAEAAGRIARLCYSASPELLAAQVDEAAAWFAELAAGLDIDVLEL